MVGTALSKDEELDAREKDIPQQEKDFAESLLKQITSRKDDPEIKEFLADININRKYARGKQHDDDAAGLVRANLIHAELKKSTNEAYAKDPEVSIMPSKSITGSRYAKWRDFGKTLEIVLSNQLGRGQANLKKHAKRAIRAADTTGIGWLKVVYQRHIERDPLIDQRINDIQDNIQNLDKLRSEVRSEEKEAPATEATKEELKQQIESLEKQAEVIRAEGLVVSLRPSEKVLFSDNVRSPEDIDRAHWIVDEIDFTVDEATRRFGWVPRSATRYLRDGKEANDHGSKGDDKQQYLVRVYEMWRSLDNRVFTLMEGFKGYIREPYTPNRVGERFFGFFPVFFDPIDGVPIPLALVSQLRELADEHNTTRTNFKEHRERSVPFNVAHGGELDPNEVDKLTNPKFMETVVLKSAPVGQPIQNAFMHIGHNPVDPAIYSTDHIRADWEQVTRRGDAARGTIAKAKTATEADILQSNLSVDTSERNDIVEEWLHEIYKYSAEIVLQEMSLEQVKRIAGEDAEWPETDMTKREIFDLVQLEIRAGSTGKPNHERELRRWLELLPQLRETLIAIADLNQQGKTKQADILSKLIRETLIRMDERLDIEELLPKQSKDDDDEEAQSKMVAQQEQQQRMAMEMKALVSDIANKDADTMKKIAETEAAEIGVQIDQYMAMLQTMMQQQQPQQQ